MVNANVVHKIAEKTLADGWFIFVNEFLERMKSFDVSSVIYLEISLQ